MECVDITTDWNGIQTKYG